jgi:hypothetical protein
MSPQPCTICEHPKRREIDRALVVPTANIHKISQEFAVSYDSLYRHHHNHLPEKVRKSAVLKEIREADRNVRVVDALLGKAVKILQDAEASGDLRTALNAIRTALEVVRTLAELTGELQAGPQVQIVNSPQWVELRAIILQTLEPFPEARIRLAERLQEYGP